jgi:hypothetical protein
VAEEFKDVDTVLMAAAKMAAISRPVMPGGSRRAMKNGKTRSPMSALLSSVAFWLT